MITEEAVRQMVYRQKITELSLQPDEHLSREAARYVQEKGLSVNACPGTKAAQGVRINRDIRPLQHRTGQPLFTDALTGQTYSEKPEHMTHLHGTTLIAKNHPRIVLRGKLDSLEAELVVQMVQARQDGKDRLVSDLGELLNLARRILAAEVTERPLEEMLLLGMDAAALRAVSHDPQERFGCGHILPSADLSRTGAFLNLLRAKTREVELAAMDAFWQDGHLDREDIIKALNRMSSACYIMMFFDLTGRYGD